MKSSLSYRSGRSENEASRRLYRAAGETAQRLEQCLSQLNNVANLFSHEITELRTRLKEYCERLIFTDPVEFGKRIEDLLWRKVYYEFFQKCKQNKKKLLESEYYQFCLHSHLMAAIGSYHHMLLRVQTEYHIDLSGKANVPFMWHLKGVKKERWKKYQQCVDSDDALHNWANQACHRILIYLGDLARYMADLQPEPENNHLAERYYLQAFCLNVNNGTPHNQLGSLADNRFDAAYHYMRCLSSPEKFEAAEGNLMRIFEKNSQMLQDISSPTENSEKFDNCSKFLTRFLKLCEIFYFGVDDNLQNCCQEALQDFHGCIPTDQTFNEDDENLGLDTFLKDHVMFKVVVMCIMGITRLKQRDSQDVSTACAFALALFSSIVHFTSLFLLSCVYETIITKDDVLKNFVSLKIQNEEEKKVINENGPKKNSVSEEKINETNHLHSSKKSSGRRKMKKFTASGLRKLRRRRKISSTSQEDSELSDVEVLELVESDEENGILNSDASQNGSCSSESLSEHEECEEEEEELEQNSLQNESNKSSKENSTCDVFIDAVEELEKPTSPIKSCIIGEQNNDVAVPIIQKSQILLSASQLLDVLLRNELLQALKILIDWLKMNKDLLELRADSLDFFFSRLIELFNLILRIEEQLLTEFRDEFSILSRTDAEWRQPFPLPEDILLQGLPDLEDIHHHLSFDVISRRTLSLSEQMFLRVQCILAFAESLSSEFKSIIYFDKGKRTYNLKKRVQESKGKNMKNCIKEKVSKESGNQKQLMHDMAHLWLKAEVNKLERSIQNSGNPQLSPLLVADTSAFCHHLSLLKQLISAKSFLVIVPNVVIDNLDQVKKKSLGAREATRWLEYVFQKGNRHIRMQREQERSCVNPIKYPRRKDKELWDFFQILECCHYLVQQQSACKSSSVVTLLVGTQNQLPSTASALTKSLNISMENLENFFAKWRTSSKKPG